MLIEVPYKDGDVVSIKLASGEEMVARLDKETADTLILSKPSMLIATEGGMGMAPFMFTTSMESKYTMRLSGVICIVKTEAETAKMYSEKTSSIVMAGV
jgi:hypothetical protein|tara:strand:+ start:293 stop:589 length:297 start_codon:yes stop_codon:yes gene_type:complete